MHQVTACSFLTLWKSKCISVIVKLTASFKKDINYFDTLGSESRSIGTHVRLREQIFLQDLNLIRSVCIMQCPVDLLTSSSFLLTSLVQREPH